MVSTTVDKTRGSSKFSAVIKYSAGSSKDTAGQETTEEMMTNWQPMEAGELSATLDNSPLRSTIGSPKDISDCPAGTQLIVSNCTLSGRLVADSDQGTSGESLLGTSILKDNVVGPLPRPQESRTINKYLHNSLTQI